MWVFFSILDNSNNLFASSNLEIVTGKFPLDMRRKWFGNIKKPQNRVKPPSLMDLNTWLQEQAIVHERLLSSLKTLKYDPVKPNADSKKRDQKDRRSNFEAFVSDKRNTNQCPLQNGIHRIWQCEAFKKKSNDDRCKTVKEKKLWVSCLNSNHQIKDCKTRKCGIDGCEKVHNRLLHKAVKSLEPLDKKEETNLTTISKNIGRGALQVDPIRVHGNAGSNEDTMALCDTGSSQTWVDQELLKKHNLDGEEVTIHVAGIHGTSPIQSKKVEITLGPAASNAANKCTIWVNSHKNLAVGKKECDLRPLKRKFGYLSCIRQNTIRLTEDKVILGQDAFPLICVVAYKNGGVNNTPWAVKLPLAWTISHCPPRKRHNATRCVARAKMKNWQLS